MLVPPPAPPSERGVVLYESGMLRAWRVRAGSDNVPRELWELAPDLQHDFLDELADAYALCERFGGHDRLLPRAIERAGDVGFVVAAVPWVRLSLLADLGPLPVELVATFAASVARELARLPPDEVLRALSPRALGITTDGGARLFETMLARPRLTTTAPGVLKGEIHYLSPENASGRPLDARSDVFSLAVVAVQLLLGEHPYARAGDPVLDVLRIMQAPPQLALAGLPPRLAEVLQAMLARAPGDRPPAADLARELAPWTWPSHRMFGEVSRLVPEAAREAILYGY